MSSVFVVYEEITYSNGMDDCIVLDIYKDLFAADRRVVEARHRATELGDDTVTYYVVEMELR